MRKYYRTKIYFIGFPEKKKVTVSKTRSRDLRERRETGCAHGRKFHLTVGGDNKYKIYHEQFLKGTQMIQSNCTYKDMSPQ